MPSDEGLGLILVIILSVLTMLTNIAFVSTNKKLKEVTAKLDKLESEYNDLIDIFKPAVIEEVPSDGEM